MKALRIISGVLGIAALLAIIYEVLISPATISLTYAIISIIAILIASIMVLIGGRIKVLIAGILFFVGGIMHMNFITIVGRDEAAAGVSKLPDYIPDIIEMAGLFIPIIAGILALVSMLEKRSPQRTNAID